MLPSQALLVVAGGISVVHAAPITMPSDGIVVISVSSSLCLHTYNNKATHCPPLCWDVPIRRHLSVSTYVCTQHSPKHQTLTPRPEYRVHLSPLLPIIYIKLCAIFQPIGGRIDFFSFKYFIYTDWMLAHMASFHHKPVIQSYLWISLIHLSMWISKRTG